ncbi:MAG: site-2 protease family protein [Oscillospiraceae bacterium]|nr:site-2 protease family protein [Oscillospiraceae bacterium]
MSSVVSILIAVLIFCFIIIIHEGGHFFAAKACGIPVNEFAIGMGPVIYKKQGKETLFTLRILPIGGFCAMGEDDEAEDENSFRSKPVWKRMIVIVAGAFMNIILGFILAVIFFLVTDKGITTRIAVFSEDAVSSSYGLSVDDVIVKINDLNVFTMNDVIYELTNDEDGVFDFTVERNGERVQLDGVTFAKGIDSETGKQTLIYDFKVYSEKITVANILPYSIKKTIYNGRIVLMSLRDIILGKYGVNDLSGPVGIVSAITEVTEEFGIDWSYILEMAMLITINVGIFNLLPLPALDGGRFVFLVIEAIRRKQLKAETEGFIHMAGMLLLMALMVFVTFNDVKKLF